MSFHKSETFILPSERLCTGQIYRVSMETRESPRILKQPSPAPLIYDNV